MKKIIATVMSLFSLFLLGCASVNPGVDISVPNNDLSSNLGNAQINTEPYIELLTSYYSDTVEALAKTPRFIVVDSIEKLSTIHAFGSELAEHTAFSFLATRNELDDATARYGAEFFDSGFLIIIVGAETIGNMRYSVQKKTEENKIDILLSAVAPPAQTTVIGAYLYPVAFEGRYSGQEISISRTYSEEVSSAA